MAFLNWSDQYSVLVKNMDAQHRRIIDLINQLHDAMKLGKGNDAVGAVLDSLVDYTRTHFAMEERLMQSYGYPDFARHKALHEDLTRQVLDIQSKFRAGQCAITINVMTFLKNWLVDHIAKSDRAYGEFMATCGVH